MRIAVIWNAPSLLKDISVRHEHFTRGFRQLGHEAFIVSTRSALEGFSEKAMAVESPQVFLEKDFWESLKIDAAVMITWHKMVGELSALKAAGVRTVSIGDSDGQFSFKVFPEETFRRMVRVPSAWGDKLKGLCLWAKYFLASEREDRASLASTELSDVVVLHHKTMKAGFYQFLRRYGRKDWIRKVVVLPYPVHNAFLTENTGGTRQGVVAVGRWDSPQKDVQLLLRSCAIYLDKSQQAQVTVLGRAFAGQFEAMKRRYGERFHYGGVCLPQDIARAMGRACSVLVVSHWEGAPSVVSEGLAMGCTVIGPPIPSLRGLCRGGHWGTMAVSRAPQAVAAAILREMQAWEMGARQAERISRFWRPRFEPRTVCGEMIAALMKEKRKAA